jgi:hypothetical protein
LSFQRVKARRRFELPARKKKQYQVAAPRCTTLIRRFPDNEGQAMKEVTQMSLSAAAEIRMAEWRWAVKWKELWKQTEFVHSAFGKSLCTYKSCCK